MKHLSKWITVILLLAGVGPINAQAPLTNSESKAVDKFEKSQEKAPDNTGKNLRDLYEDRVTAENQSNRRSDLDYTRDLRQAIMSHPGFSINAQNIKIITQNGVMTLRGPVETLRERELIGNLAKQCCGSQTITNQLEVKEHSNQSYK